jgi:hypothetical protein
MKPVLFLITCLICSVTYGQNYSQLVNDANEKYLEKEYKKSVELYKRAFAKEQKSRTDFYNAGCSAALTGDVTLALSWLNQAFSNGFVNIRHMKSDSDLNSLHKTQGWKSLVATMQAKVDQLEANYDKPLQAKLLAIYDDDQKDRQRIEEIGKKYGYNSKEVDKLWKTIAYKDSVNLLNVKAILDQYGWVGEDKVGPQANTTLFLVIQHADLATQQTYLPMMRKAVADKKAEPSALALLEDRVALGEKRRQTYGSQIGEDSTGTAYVLPLADPDNVDKRRAEVGLTPLAEYVKHWGIKWDVDDYKKQLPAIEKLEGIK